MRLEYALTFTLKSSNSKTGPIPVTTTDRHSCWDGCAFFNNGCYFDQFRNKQFWNKLTAVGPRSEFANGNAMVKTLSWDDMVERITALPIGQLWRHNQGGDLPHNETKIDWPKLDALIVANEGKRGFTYTHHNTADEDNLNAIYWANARGFTINLSANNLADADRKAELGVGPVVVTLPSDVHGKQVIKTPAGREVIPCPASYRDDFTCADCGLCARQRKVIIGFPAHGAGKGKVDAIARG